MDARERARLRFREWMQRPGAPTQEDLAKLLTDRGVRRSQSWVSKVLSGGPSVSNLDLLAEIMGVSASDLVAAIPEGTVADTALPGVTADERRCLALYQRLPRGDREIILQTLVRLGGAPSGAEFRDEDRDGKTNRRSGVDRRKEDPKSAA